MSTIFYMNFVSNCNIRIYIEAEKLGRSESQLVLFLRKSKTVFRFRNNQTFSQANLVKLIVEINKDYAAKV